MTGRRVAIVALGGATIAAAALALPAILSAAVEQAETTRFAVWDQEADEAVYERTVAVGEAIVLEHTHSVTHRTVIETFSVQDPTTIALEELWFDEFGANLPDGPELIGDRTTTFLQENGAYRVLHHGYPIGSVPLRVGSPEVDHMLTFEDGRRVRLLDVARPGSHVDLVVGGG